MSLPSNVDIVPNCQKTLTIGVDGLPYPVEAQMHRGKVRGY